MTDYSNNENRLGVELENFQSISNASLEFVKGINLIVGQSNSGKSAILRAIKGAIMNPNSSQKYIKNGTKGFKVALEYNGNNIEWSRGSKSAQYTINGEEYKKVGGANLTDLLDNSGFAIHEGKDLMNIESELELPFPFDKNNTELFKLFEKNIFCVSDSTAILKLIKNDELDVTSRMNTAVMSKQRYVDKLDALKYLEESVDINKLVKGREELSTLITNRDELNTDINDLKNTVKVGKVLSKAVQPVDIDTDLPNNYNNLVRDLKLLEHAKQIVGVLKPTEEPSVTSNDINAYMDIKKDIETLENAKKLVSILRPLEEPTMNFAFDGYTSLASDLKALSKLRQDALVVQNNLKEIRSNIERLEAEKQTYKVCPLCGGELNG